MSGIDDLPTPCIVIERRRLEANLVRMQTRAAAQGVTLRPHTKTHKTVAIARRQKELGARGITVAKVGEAEVFAKKGFRDILVAYPVTGKRKHERIGTLLRENDVVFCVDTIHGAQQASAVYEALGLCAPVFLEIDTGGQRCGQPWDDRNLESFARSIVALKGLHLKGILTHEGHSYKGPQNAETKDAALRRVMRQSRDRMLRVAVRLKEANVPGATPGEFTVSMGSTPSMSVFENRTQSGFSITEIRPGNYVFHDVTQFCLGAASLQDCALSVLTTVVSRHRDKRGTERLFLDAGSKILTSDRALGADGFGLLLYNPKAMVPDPHARIIALSEEHAWVRVRGGATQSVGDRVRVIPNHACVVMNTQDESFLVDGDEVVACWRVDARGRVR